ncbi:MAG TPA: aldehyde dehydrogenase family protein [Pseudobdellovibrionaceae bacterium]|nr:aldehyde dehydrogenase family protein [Pseudobdellovibrionaceae bacterium]
MSSQETANLELRARALRAAGEFLRQGELADELTRLIHQQTGKPWAWAQGEVQFCLGSWDAMIDEAFEALKPQLIVREGETSRIEYRARGHVVIFSPFNSSLECVQLGLVSALMAGNRVSVKLSPDADLAASRWLREIREASGLPLEWVKGDALAGMELLDRGFDMLVFTGSERVGRELARRAAERLVPCVLELGGKDLLIVRADADLAAAAEFAVENAFGYCGQSCTASEQILVDERVAEAWLAQFRERLGARVDYGVYRGSVSRLESLVTEALDAGAQIAAGSAHWPMLLDVTDVPIDAPLRIFNEEIFAPLACLRRYSSEAEIPKWSARLGFGLGAVIFTRDSELTGGDFAFANLPHAMIGVNSACVGVQGTPWLGRGRSGLGQLGGADGHRQFAVPQVITSRAVAPRD